jgi:ubiquinone/menaquinone biosynthesis C-methylase UbiE
MNLKDLLISQFMKPKGFLGNLAGYIMAHRPSNRERIFWTISLLAIKPGDRVLEIGFGPGVAIEQISRIVTNGFIAGIDHSKVMVRQARKRNREGIHKGKSEIMLGSAADMPHFGQPFDKIFAINAFQFWNEPDEILKNLKKLLKPGGIIALTLQPRLNKATDEGARKIGEEIVKHLEEAGYANVRLETKKMKPVSAGCAIGIG